MTTTQNQFVIYITTQNKVLKSILKKCHRNPSKDGVHKARVTIRRIRSILNLIKYDIKELKRLAKLLGRLRDLDVAIQNSSSFQLNSKRLSIKRKKALLKIRPHIRKKKRKQLIKKVELAKLKIEKSSRKDIGRIQKKLYYDLKNQMINMKKNNLHKTRINIKKIRYFFETKGKPTSELQRAQNTLGEIHDLEILQNYFKDNNDIKKKKKQKVHAAEKKIIPIMKRTLNSLKMENI